jgi:carbon storage regulator CsrA
VRVAIDAPRQIPVHREEIYQQVQEENRKAAISAAESNPTALWQRSRGGKK